MRRTKGISAAGWFYQQSFHDNVEARANMRADYREAIPQQMLTLPEFAARCLWLEHARLRENISEHEAHKHLRKTIARMKANDLGISGNTEWAGIVKGWYRAYQLDTFGHPKTS